MNIFFLSKMENTNIVKHDILVITLLDDEVKWSNIPVLC